MAISYEVSTFEQFGEELIAASKVKEPARSPKARKRESSQSNKPGTFERQSSVHSSDPQLMEFGTQTRKPQRLAGGLPAQDRQHSEGGNILSSRDVLQLAVLMEADKLNHSLQETRLLAATEAQRMFEEERIVCEQEAQVDYSITLSESKVWRTEPSTT